MRVISLMIACIQLSKKEEPDLYCCYFNFRMLAEDIAGLCRR